MKPLVNKRYKLERFPGKGGWTFARIPEIAKDKSQPFGWVKVRGTIDGVEIKKYHLMPMGNGQLFLPVKAEIRKKIRKEEGDTITVILYPDNEPLEIPKEFSVCLEDEPNARDFFFSLSEGERKYYLNWILTAKKENTKVRRLAETVTRLSHRRKFHDRR